EVNKIFENENRQERIDHRSLEAQGITDRLPTIHEGPIVREMEQRGKCTDRGEINRTVKAHNAVVVELETYRKEKADKQQKKAEKAHSGREEAHLVVTVDKESKSIVQELGANMNVIEKRPYMAYEF